MGTEIFSPDGHYRWDGQAWQPVAASEPSNVAPTTTIMPSHAKPSSASWSIPGMRVIGFGALVVVILVGVIIVATGHRSPKAVAAAGTRVGTSSTPAGNAQSATATAKALSACASMSTVVKQGSGDIYDTSLAATNAQSATQLDPSSDAIAQVQANISAYQQASAAFWAANAAWTTDNALGDYAASDLDIHKQGEAIDSQETAKRALSAACVNLGGAPLAIPAPSGSAAAQS